jgi:hypothetical protein
MSTPTSKGNGRAGVATMENNLNVGKFFDCFEEARLPLTRACRTSFNASEAQSTVE